MTCFAPARGRRTIPALRQTYRMLLLRGVLTVAMALGSGVVARRVEAQDAAAATKAPPTAETTVDLRAIDKQAQETHRRVMPAVVAVSGGSGVVVSADGYVLTVAHVGMRSGRRVTITFPDGRVVRGKTLGNDQGMDAGLIKIDGDGPYPFVPMAKSADVKQGAWCLALGYPVRFERGKPPALRIGRVLRNQATMIITDCTIMGGDSGGPLFDLEGNLIGVSSRCDDRLTTNIHVPVDCYRNVWDRLAKGEDFDSLRAIVAYLGVGPEENSDEPRVGRIYAESGAQRAGMEVGDVLLKFDGTELSRYSQLPPLIERHKPGDEVEIEIRRGENTLKLKAKLGQRED
jgi:serine protease Do